MSTTNTTGIGTSGDHALYAPGRKIYAKKIDGQFRRIKLGIQLFTLAVYYLLPFVRWNRGLNEPSQAVLVDFEHSRFYFFFIEIWPQEVYYVTGLLILAGHMREQVCLYMCPWPRIQAALTDEYALNVTYRFDRGEPRESLKHAAALRAQGALAGDCIDCGQCVAVCPTGVDIRQGASLGCIQCGLCIDACDAVMSKVDRPSRLIAYETEMNIERRQCGKASIYRPIRVRTVTYALLILVIGGFMSFTLATRSDVRLSLLHDRNPLTVKLKDGSVRNAYTARLSNMTAETRRFTLDVSGLKGAEVEVVGAEPDAQGHIMIETGPDQTREARVLVTIRGLRAGASQLPVIFTARAIDGRSAMMTVKDVFVWP